MARKHALAQPAHEERCNAQPDLRPADPKTGPRTRGVTLAVYAPFGTDPVLSAYPDGSSTTLVQHPLMQNLLKVAESGVRVSALIDRVDEDTALVDIPPGAPERLKWQSRCKVPGHCASRAGRVRSRSVLSCRARRPAAGYRTAPQTARYSSTATSGQSRCSREARTSHGWIRQPGSIFPTSLPECFASKSMPAEPVKAMGTPLS